MLSMASRRKRSTLQITITTETTGLFFCPLPPIFRGSARCPSKRAKLFFTFDGPLKSLCGSPRYVCRSYRNSQWEAKAIFQVLRSRYQERRQCHHLSKFRTDSRMHTAARPDLDATLSLQSHAPAKANLKFEFVLPSQIARDFPRVRQARNGS